MNLPQYEVACWRLLVEKLVSTGAVTEQDCRHRVGDPPNSPGTELFNLIRTWGDAYATLRTHERTYP